MDRLVPLDPAAAIKLDKSILERFPVGYRHLAYLQTKGGFKVKPDLPGTDGPAVDALYAKGADWLKGKKLVTLVIAGRRSLHAARAVGIAEANSGEE